MSRNQLLPWVALPVLLAGASCSQPSVLVYSAGFSFSKYDFLVFAKPIDGQTTALYGMDVEIANLMARYNMKIIGDKELPNLSLDAKAKTLFVRGAISTFNKTKNVITISFDDAITGKTVANVTASSAGNLYKPNDRNNALEAVTQPLIEALSREKGLAVRATAIAAAVPAPAPAPAPAVVPAVQ